MEYSTSNIANLASNSLGIRVLNVKPFAKIISVFGNVPIIMSEAEGVAYYGALSVYWKGTKSDPDGTLKLITQATININLGIDIFTKEVRSSKDWSFDAMKQIYTVDCSYEGLFTAFSSNHTDVWNIDLLNGNGEGFMSFVGYRITY